MAHRLQVLNSSFEFIYAAKSKSLGPFQDVVARFGAPIHWHFDDQVGAPPDLEKLIQDRIDHQKLGANECQLYACGPEPMLEAFLKACEHLSLPHAHIERFKAPETPSQNSIKKTYTVALKKSNKSFQVSPDTTLLQALRHHNVDVDTSCEEGVCGACETRVLSGIPEHLDYVLSDQEREKNKVMMVCVSSCKSEHLELDL
jgi:ferredoxin